ncbi:MAG: hypothetical protein ABIN94_13105 [Ferruginibacter sp.]
MTSSYKILFSIDLLNDYYKDGRCPDFSIIPSSETRLLFRNCQLLYKNIGNRLVVLTKVKNDSNPIENGKPFMHIDPDTKFNFYLSLNKPEFTSFTNIDLDGFGTMRFYFTNLNRNKHQSFSHLTAAINDYDNTKQYQPGDFADDGTKKIFECIKTTTGHNTTNINFWVSRDDVQFVSSADFLQPKNTLLNYRAATAATAFKVYAYALDTISNKYASLAFAKTITFNSPVSNLQVDLSKLMKGKYRLTVNNEDLFIYIDDEMIYGGYFGVVEILTHLPNGDDFAFLDVNGKPAEREYFIRFANRLAKWKYITPRHGVIDITHPTNKYTFNPEPLPSPNTEYFESNVPVPLTQLPEEFTLQVSAQVSSSSPRAPGPDISVPGVITRPSPDNDFFCNIYLNY